MLGFTMVDFALVDGHCHGVFGGTPDPATFARWSTEADRPTDGLAYANSPVGHAILRWCAEPMGLEPGLSLENYLDRRTELGPQESIRRLMTAAWLSDLLVDTGISGEGFAEPSVLGAVTEAGVHEVVRLESVAEQVVADGADAVGFAEAFVDALATATAHAVGVKSIVAYRHGLDIEPTRPSPDDVREAAKQWLTAGDPARLTHPVLLRFLLWCAVDRGLPIQFHTGFGDRDLRFARANPALLQPFVEAAEPSGVPIVLLHCYPYHREAGWLAHVYPNVYLDLGLTMSYVGAQASAVLGEYLELAPFGKVLFSTDAYGLPELYCAGATQFRHALDAVLRRWAKDGLVSSADTERIAHAIGAGNAQRLYGLRARTR
ncbi:amidohydrolase family protein [Flindersiella endophytica]